MADKRTQRRHLAQLRAIRDSVHAEWIAEGSPSSGETFNRLMRAENIVYGYEGYLRVPFSTRVTYSLDTVTA